MRRRSLLAVLLSGALLASPVFSADDGKVALTGEIVDSACYIKSAARGESHRTCAQKCADVGIPLALVEDGSGKVIWIASVNDMETPNAKLRPFAGRRVTVTGVWAERGGARILLLHDVKAVPAS